MLSPIRGANWRGVPPQAVVVVLHAQDAARDPELGGRQLQLRRHRDELPRRQRDQETTHQGILVTLRV